DRGPMMIEPGCKVYRGMIVGEHTRGNDLEVNVLKGKKLTNIRTHAKDEAIRLTPPIRMKLEKALAYIDANELIEATPKAIRLGKKLLDPNERKRDERRKEAERATERVWARMSAYERACVLVAPPSAMNRPYLVTNSGVWNASVAKSPQP